jgi:hypothetical protein
MNEKTIAQKMYLYKARSIAVLNGGAGSAALLAQLPADVVDDGDGPHDVVVLFARSQRELEELLPRAKARLAAKGALWVGYVKGTSPLKGDLHRDTIMAYAESIGLTGAAMISIDADWSCLRLKAV